LPGIFVYTVPTPLLLGCTLFAFGTLDAAMNVQVVIVERESGGSMMSGFHGLFSVGGFIAGGVRAAPAARTGCVRARFSTGAPCC
jgi:hypothetical protein